MNIPNSLFFVEIAKLIKDGHTITFNCKGNSMRPMIESDRDNILLGKLERKAKKNDIILAKISGIKCHGVFHKSEGIYVLHRVIKVSGKDIWLLGDGNVNSYEFCTQENIVGIALGFYRGEQQKFISTTSLQWKIYSFFWTHLKFFRRYLLYAYKNIILK